MNDLETINPYTGETIKKYPYLSLDEVNHSIDDLKAAFKIWRKTDVKDRVFLLKQALDYFKTNQNSIAQEITDQMGKPLTQAIKEVDTMLGRANYLLEIAEDTLKPDQVKSTGGLNQKIVHEPLGVVFVLSTWNYPLLISINGVFTALLCGNTVLLKHSRLTPSIGQHFEKAFGQLGNYKNLLKSVIVDHQTAMELIQKEKVDHVIFTGSVSGGHQISSSLSHSFIACNLELGGKDGVYVADDADINLAASTIVDGAMYNAGQSCCGVERVYAHKDIYDELLKQCGMLISKYSLGDPKKPETTMGPLATESAAKEMQRQIEDAVSQGAVIKVGGHSKKIQQGTFFEPTLLIDVKQNMRIMQEENFGPILPIMQVESDDEAIGCINDSKYGLTAAIFTSDPQRAEKFANKVEAGTIFMNQCDYLDPALPWTGVKDSGKGSALSKYGFYELTRRKALNFKLG